MIFGDCSGRIGDITEDLLTDGYDGRVSRLGGDCGCSERDQLLNDIVADAERLRKYNQDIY